MRKNHLAELTAEYEKSILFAIYHGHMVMEESLAGSGKFQCRKALGKRRRRRRDDLADLLRSTDCGVDIKRELPYVFRVIAFEDDSVETVMFVALAPQKVRSWQHNAKSAFLAT